MRLVSLEVNGVRRLIETKCFLGGKLNAIVGPNEAGKTTLLFALKSVTDNESIPESYLSRGAKPEPSRWVIRGNWEIEDSDRDSLQDFDLEQHPTRLQISKTADGSRRINVIPSPARRQAPYKSAIRPLTRFLDSSAGRALPRSEDAPRPDEAAGDRLDQILSDLRANEWRTWAEAEVARLQLGLEDVEEQGGNPASLARRAARALRHVLDSAQRRDPNDTVWRELLSRVPPCVEFARADRDLQSSYELTEINLNDPPRAFANLLGIAQLDAQNLIDLVQRGDTGSAATLLRRANDRMADFYGRAWSQSELRVVIDRDGTRLDILIEEVSGDSYTLAERSDGLRAFVALTAFLSRHELYRPVLLIDEADTHLHYDAQRDLIDVLLEQEVAQQVVYTTHSPGCLPPDLGSDVRAIVPIEGRPGRSAVHNSFWNSNSPGFSPLLLMMGAAAAAFSSSRAAVLAEGPSDMILLPTLIRRAIDEATLPYHIAPGLSATSPSRYGEFDLVATRLVYVVDGDAGGSAIRRNLVKFGFSQDKVLTLGGEESNLTLEDLVDEACLLRAVNSELRMTSSLQLETLPAGLGGYARVELACKAADIQPPSKTALAGRLMWQTGGPILSDDGRRALRVLHRSITRLLQLRPPG